MSDDKTPYPGSQLRTTRENLAALTVSLGAYVGIDPWEEARFLGLWFMAQQVQEALTKAGPGVGVPAYCLDGTMNQGWVKLFGALSARWAIARTDGSFDKVALAEGGSRLANCCHSAVTHLAASPSVYEAAVVAARSKGFFETKYIIENWPVDADGVRVRPRFPELDRELDDRPKN